MFVLCAALSPIKLFDIFTQAKREGSRRSISTVIHESLFRSIFIIYMFNLFVAFFLYLFVIKK